jgi:hypothetical protein
MQQHGGPLKATSTSLFRRHKHPDQQLARAHLVALAMIPLVALSACETTHGTKTGRHVTWNRTVQSGKTGSLSAFSQVNPDCSIGRLPTIQVVSGPSHGTVKIVREDRFPAFRNGSDGEARQKCNTRKVPMVAVLYTPSPGFTGSDEVKIVAKGVIDDNYQFVNVHVSVSK